MRYLPVPSAAVVAGTAVVLGIVLGSTTAHMQDRTSARTRVYTAALAAIETDYVEPMPEVCSPSTVCGAELLIYGSIDGMLRTLDPHSSYFPPRDFARMRERQEGRYFGIGIQIQQDPATQDVTVTSLFEGSPAYRAGIRRGDVIAGVGEEMAKDWVLDDVVNRVKGPKGPTVEQFVPRGQPNPGSDVKR